MRRVFFAATLSAALILTASCGTKDEPAAAPTTASDLSDPTQDAPGEDVGDETAEDTAAAPPPAEDENGTGTATESADPSDSDEAEETTDGAAPPGEECSSSGYTPGDLKVGDSPEPVVEHATMLLDAAVGCDSDALISAAEADQPTLSFGETPPEEALGLPDVEGRYLALAVLLTATTPSQEAYEGDGPVTVWPAAYSAEATDADWQEIVDAGLYSPEEVDQMRSAEGYSGWRVGIAEDGSWLFFVAGD